MAMESSNNPLVSPPAPFLPQYPELIMVAIEALNDSNGSSKSAIAKHIKSTYGDLPKTHAALLAHHLNMMKNTSELVLVKNNYMKPDPNAPPKRGRGRPPKAKTHLPSGTVSSPPRPHGVQARRFPCSRSSLSLSDGFEETFCVAVYLITYNFIPDPSNPFSLILSVILLYLLAPLMIPAYAFFTAWAPKPDLVAPELSLDPYPRVDEPFLRQTTVNDTHQMPEAAMEAKRRPGLMEDHTIFEAMKTLDFWILLMSFLCGVGTGLEVMNNMGKADSTNGDAEDGKSKRPQYEGPDPDLAKMIERDVLETETKAKAEEKREKKKQ
ncbi:hypothetical protein ACFX2F_021542 [Malus domestica]